MQKHNLKISSSTIITSKIRFYKRELHWLPWNSIVFFWTFIMALPGTYSFINSTLLAIIVPHSVQYCILYWLTSNVLNELTNWRLLYLTVGHWHGTCTYKCFPSVLIGKLQMFIHHLRLLSNSNFIRSSSLPLIRF